MRKFFKALYPTLILAAICLVVALALSSTNMVTKDKIAQIEEQKAQEAMNRVLPGEYELKTVEDTEYYEVTNDSGVIGYIFITSDNGYGGEVRVMTAVLTDGTIKAIEILDVSNETPGLGQKATEETFYGQFAGMSGELTVKKSGANAEAGEVEAITGATRTSNGVTGAVNKALALCQKISGEGEQDEE
ncbi:MAG: FMN-binding protein [Clostridia bacterium]|nr:FMN-binding protein [Clostridia bacterium]